MSYPAGPVLDDEDDVDQFLAAKEGADSKLLGTARLQTLTEEDEEAERDPEAGKAAAAEPTMPVADARADESNLLPAAASEEAPSVAEDGKDSSSLAAEFSALPGQESADQQVRVAPSEAAQQALPQVSEEEQLASSAEDYGCAELYQLEQTETKLSEARAGEAGAAGKYPGC